MTEPGVPCPSPSAVPISCSSTACTLRPFSQLSSASRTIRRDDDDATEPQQSGGSSATEDEEGDQSRKDDECEEGEAQAQDRVAHGDCIDAHACWREGETRDVSEPRLTGPRMTWAKADWAKADLGKS